MYVNHPSLDRLRQASRQLASQTDALESVTQRQLADLLKVSRQHVTHMVDRGEFPPGFKVGRCRRWRIEQVKEFIKQNEGAEK